ncbi:MAG: hypothetical protein ACC619_04940 [Paracoccaceae bacterium]
MSVAILAGLIVAFLVALGFGEYLMARGRYRPLSKSFGQRRGREPDLGSEAIDIDIVRDAQRSNNMAATHSSAQSGTPDLTNSLRHMPGKPKTIKDDETYAQNWFRAFGKKTKRTKK